MARELASRVNANAQEVQSGNQQPSLMSTVQQMLPQFEMAAPRGVEAAQLVRDAMTMLRQTPRLAECDRMSVLGGLMTCAQLGLRPGVLGHAWLIPFKGKAQLVIGYQGMVELAHRSGRVSSLIARQVHENDDFDVDYGLADTIRHRPALRGDRGPVVGYYAIVKYGNPDGHSFLYMTRQEVEYHRDRFAMAKDRTGAIVGPWRDHFDAMALKTVVRQLAKWMPKATDLGSAIEADGRVRVDITPDADVVNVSHLPVIEAGPSSSGDDVDDAAWEQHQAELLERDATLEADA